MAEAFKVILADIHSAGAPEPMIFDEDWLREPGSCAAMLRWPGGSGSGCGLAVWSDRPTTDNVVSPCGQLQDEIVEQLWEQGRSAVWRQSPDHPDSHPLKPVGVHGVPTWVCPRTGRSIARIGDLGTR